MFDFLGGSDYEYGPYTVTISAGEIDTLFDLPVIDDNLLEGNEHFDLFIIPRFLPDRVTRGDLGRTTVTIVDDEGKLTPIYTLLTKLLRGKILMVFTFIHSNHKIFPQIMALSINNINLQARYHENFSVKSHFPL